MKALSYAASGGHGQIVRLLIEKDADNKLINNVGFSPANLAYEHGHKEVLFFSNSKQFLIMQL